MTSRRRSGAQVRRRQVAMSPLHSFDQHSFETEVGRRVTRLPSGCWSFDGKLDGRPDLFVKGQGRLLKAYRWLYEELVGEVPSGHVLHHRCLNGWCVNPDHLQPMTRDQHIDLHRSLR